MEALNFIIPSIGIGIYYFEFVTIFRKASQAYLLIIINYNYINLQQFKLGYSSIKIYCPPNWHLTWDATHKIETRSMQVFCNVFSGSKFRFCAIYSMYTSITSIAINPRLAHDVKRKCRLILFNGNHHGRIMQC